LLLDGADLVFIDTAPAADNAAAIAAKAADLILIPCRPAAFDLEAMSTTLNLAHAVQRLAVLSRSSHFLIKSISALALSLALSFAMRKANSTDCRQMTWLNFIGGVH
jgi:cellulose biosynthesis protein BcsQ